MGQLGPTVERTEIYSISCDKSFNGKEYKKEYVHMTESLCCTAEIKSYKSTIIFKRGKKPNKNTSK